MKNKNCNIITFFIIFLVFLIPTKAQQNKNEILDPILSIPIAGLGDFISWCPDATCFIAEIIKEKYSGEAKRSFLFLAIVDTTTGQITDELSLSSDDSILTAIFFQSNTKLIIATLRGLISVWNFETRELEYEILYFSSPGQIIFNATQTEFLISDRSDGALYIWNIQQQKPRLTFTGWGIWGVDDKTILIMRPLSDNNTYLYVHDAVTGKEKFRIDTGIAMDGFAFNTTYQYLIIYGRDGISQLWDFTQQTKLLDIPSYFAIWEDETHFGYWNNQTRYIYDVETKEILTFGHDGDIAFLGAWSNSNKSLILSDYSSFPCEANCYYGTYVWNIVEEQILTTMKFGDNEPLSQWYLDTSQIVSRENRTSLIIWEATSGDILYRLEHPKVDFSDDSFPNAGSTYVDFNISSDGKILSFLGVTLYIWEIPE